MSTKVIDASTFNISDFLKDAVTLPRDAVTVYLDGAAAWEYSKLSTEREKVNARLSDKNRSIADDGGLGDLEERTAAVLDRLKASATRFHLHALLPVEIKNSTDQARREAKASFKETPSEEDLNKAVAERFLYLAMQKSVDKIDLPGGDLLMGPLTTDQLKAFRDRLDASEWGQIVDLYSDLNTRAAIRDAQVDAGFPRRDSDSAGE